MRKAGRVPRFFVLLVFVAVAFVDFVIITGSKITPFEMRGSCAVIGEFCGINIKIDVVIRACDNALDFVVNCVDAVADIVVEFHLVFDEFADVGKLFFEERTTLFEGVENVIVISFVDVAVVDGAEAGDNFGDVPCDVEDVFFLDLIDALGRRLLMSEGYSRNDARRSARAIIRYNEISGRHRCGHMRSYAQAKENQLWFVETLAEYLCIGTKTE